jgi:hypothetical protein
MEIRADSLDSSQSLRGSAPRTAQKTVVFPRDVVSAVAGISGYLAEFSGADDHHVGLLDIRLSTHINGDAVTVTGPSGVYFHSMIPVSEADRESRPPSERHRVLFG